MDPDNSTTASGWEVVRTATQLATTHLGDELAAVFAIGSLAHGGFSPNVSDVDIVLVTRSEGPIEGVAAAVTRETQRELGSELASRLSVFHAPQGLLASPPPGARLPAIDLLDLLDHGVLVWGSDVRDGTERPSDEAVVAEAIAFSAARTDPQALAALVRDAKTGQPLDVRTVTKHVLAPVRLLAMVRGRRVRGNDEAASDYRGPHAELVEAAIRWRREGALPPPDVVAPLLDIHLLALHTEAFEEIAEGKGEFLSL